MATVEVDKIFVDVGVNRSWPLHPLYLVSLHVAPRRLATKDQLKSYLACLPQSQAFNEPILHNRIILICKY